MQDLYKAPQAEGASSNLVSHSNIPPFVVFCFAPFLLDAVGVAIISCAHNLLWGCSSVGRASDFLDSCRMAIT